LKEENSLKIEGKVIWSGTMDCFRCDLTDILREQYMIEYGESPERNPIQYELFLIKEFEELMLDE